MRAFCDVVDIVSAVAGGVIWAVEDRKKKAILRSPFYIGITIFSIIVITVTFMVRSGPFKKFILI